MHSELRTSFSFKRYFLAIILLFVFLTITISLYLIVKKKRRNFHQAIFENRSMLAKEALAQRIENYFLILRSTRALFSSSDTVKYHEWQNFISSLQIEKHYPGATGIGYCMIINREEVPQLTSFAKKDINPDFHIWPNSKHHKKKAPIVFWRPFTMQKSALGFDVLYEATRKSAVEQAITDNSPVISGKVTLVTEPDTMRQPGFLIYMPVYKNNISVSSTEDRNKNVQGIIVSPFRSYDFVNAILKKDFPDLDIEIFDDSISSKNLLYDGNKNTSIIKRNKILRTVEVLTFQGNKWKIIFESSQKTMTPSENEFPIIVLLSGTLISLLIFLITWAVLHNKHKSDVTQNIIREKNNQLTVINNDLDNFVYTASHDLKSPINNLEGLMRMIEEEVKNSNNTTLPPMVKMMDESVVKLKNTIIELTDIGRIQKETEATYEVIDFKELIEEVLFNHKKTIEEIDAKIEYNLEEKEIKFSKKNLRSMLENLISNALKYHSPDRRPQLFLQTYIKDKQIHFCIKDNGLGIPEDQQEMIFGMFKRAHSHVPGSGVGLYLVKRIMDNSGGKVVLESKENVGSTFTLIFKNLKSKSSQEKKSTSAK